MREHLSCGPKGIRTPDLLDANEARYQLRHRPVNDIYVITLASTDRTKAPHPSLSTGVGAFVVAVTVGFEPTVGGYPTQLFESCTFGRSDTSPRISLRHRGRARESAGHQAAATSAWVRRMPSVEPAGARPMPHSVATPNSGANGTAAAIRRRAPSAPSSRCTSPR